MKVNNAHIIELALALMKIEYDNWNACLEHCPGIREDRKTLHHYVGVITEQMNGKLNDTETDK